MRVAAAFSLSIALGCAGASVRAVADPEELRELRAQVTAQSAMVAMQQHRIEDLEIKLAALQARTQPALQQPAAAPPASSAPRAEPRPGLKTVKLGGRRPNPVERAPHLPATLALREPDEDSLSRLDTSPDLEQQRESAADFAWARAVQKLNEGDHAHAESDFLAFAAAHPDHTAADNALYLAGLVREVRGDCKGALALLESVPHRYPAGDAVPMAMLEHGRCLRLLGRRDEAKITLMQLVKEHADAPETAQARQLLIGL